MRSPLCIGLLTLMLLGGGWPDLSTPPSPPTQDGARDAALVIGIERYDRLDAVEGARDLALAWTRWLQQRHGVPVVVPILDDDATLEEITVALDQVAGRVGEGGRLWVVFIGHGAGAPDGELLLLGADARATASSAEARGLRTTQLTATFKTKLHSTSEALLLRDAPPLPELSQPAGGDTSWGDRISILTAGAAPEDEPRLAYLTLGGLRGWADVDQDGVVTMGELLTYARQAGPNTQPRLVGHPDLAVAQSAKEPPPGPAQAQEELDFAARVARAREEQEQRSSAESIDTGRQAREEALQETRAASPEAAALQNEAYLAYLTLPPAGSEPTQEYRTQLQNWLVNHDCRSVGQGALQTYVEMPEIALVEEALHQALASTPTVQGESTLGAPGEAGERWVSPTGIAFRRIPASTNTLGCNHGQSCFYEHHQITQQVTISRDYWVSEVPITIKQAARIKGDPVYNAGQSCHLPMPAYWVHAVEIANALSEREGLEPCYTIDARWVRWRRGPRCEGYRLPTAAEFEIAARAGTNLPYPGSEDPSEVIWYRSNASERKPGGLLAPNAWGLFDMGGNAIQWVWDAEPRRPQAGTTLPPATDPVLTQKVRIDREPDYLNYDPNIRQWRACDMTCDRPYLVNEYGGGNPNSRDWFRFRLVRTIDP